MSSACRWTSAVFSGSQLDYGVENGILGCLVSSGLIETYVPLRMTDSAMLRCCVDECELTPPGKKEEATRS